MPDRRELRTLLRALLLYVDHQIERDAAALNTTSDNPEKSLDTTGSAVEDPPVPPLGMSARDFKTMRRVAGLTMAEAAKALGVTERTVLRWEHGETRIDPLKVPAIRLELRPSWQRVEIPTSCPEVDTEDDGSSDV